jgi:hypothetical protein
MISNKAQYKYIICHDSLDIYHPDDDYDMYKILEEYKVKPTHPKVITYTDAWIKTKSEFEKFIIESDLKVRRSNGLHCESYYTFEVLVFYDKEWNLKGIAARTIKDGVTQNDKEKLYL